jgi:hypothetical protein
MKALWTALSIFAVANLIATASFVGWLVNADRLDSDRAKRVREIFTTTISDEKAAADQQLVALEDKKKAEEAAEKEKLPPLTAAEQLAARLEATELDRQRAERMKREVQDLRTALANERDRMDAEWKKLRETRKAHEEEVALNERIVGSEQFRKTLTVLTKLEPKETKNILVQMLNGAGTTPVTADADSGLADSASSPSGLPQVLAYLDAMEDKTRTAIMSEFARDDAGLAARLLEALRIRGTFAAASQSAP